MRHLRKLQAAVVYHSAAAYREPVFERLFSESDLPVEFTLFTGTSSNQSSIRLMDSQRAGQPFAKGGLRWRLIRNFWLGQFLFQPRVLRLPWEKRWDCVIFLGNPYYLSTWLSALLCRWRGKKVLMWTHGYRTKPRSRLKRAFKNLFYKLADGLVLYGQRAKTILVAEGFSPDRLFIAYNSAPGVPPPQSQAHADRDAVEHRFKQTAPSVIWVGRMTPAKQLPLLVEAVKILHAGGTPCHVILVGDGPERPEIQNLVAANGLEAFFHIPGAVHDQVRLAQYLKAARVAVSPGSVGLFAILAHGHGLPLVTHNDWSTQGPEAEIIVENQTGTFFDAKDAEALATELGAWLTQPEKCQAAKAICANRVAQCYLPEVQVRVLRDAVNAVCHEAVTKPKVRS